VETSSSNVDLEGLIPLEEERTSLVVGLADKGEEV